MPRPALDLDFYKEKIISLFQTEHTSKDIANHLSQRENVNINYHTIQCHLQEWGISKWVKTENSSQLHEQIAVLFYECCLKDKEMLDVLHQEGYQLEKWALVQIQKQLNLIQQISIPNREESDTWLLKIVQKELDKSIIMKYEQGHLHTYFWDHEHLDSQSVTILIATLTATFSLTFYFTI